MMKLLGVAALLGVVGAQNTTLPTVDLGYEVYRATGFNSSGNFYNFSNIRYAAPPLGNLRFAPPQAPAKDRSAINNGTTNRICVQGSPKWQDIAAQVLASQALGLNISNINFSIPPANASSPVSRPDPRESEDCLFLDVFVPESVLNRKGRGKGAAVLVWIYGGGYTGGNKNTNPAGLIAASGNTTNGDIIFVSLNYRLGAFGWLSGPSFQAEGGTSNAALYDQRFALEWIQKHIHLFGGDKDRVTVIGESAGGGSIMHQITAYGGLKGKAPFAQAVPQSPGWLPIQNNVQQEDIYQKFLNLTNSTSLADLRRLPTETLIRANAQQVGYDSAWGTFTYGPVVDGVFAPLQPGQLLAQGRFDKSVKVMVGHNANEGALFTPPYLQSESSVQAQIKNAYPYAPQKSLDYITKTLYPPVFNGSYPYSDQYTRSSLIVAESSFTCNTRYLSTAYGNQTYSYLFAIPPALHGQDVSYTFFTGGAASPTNARGVQNSTVAIALQKFITSFAETGEPAADGIRQFNIYGPNAAVLKLNVTGIDEVRDSNANARCAWWQKALY